MSVVLPLLGTALILLLLADVFSTVLHPRGRGGMLNRRQNRWLWALFATASRRADGSVSDGLLALAGPVLILTSLIVWVLLLIAGFALIYYPFMGSFLVSPGSLHTPWVEAVYYSGYTSATLGFGDLVPNTAALRLLAPVEAFGGFALLSVSVTYFLAVYRELIRMQGTAADVATYFEPGDEHLLSFVREHGHEPVARWAESISSALSSVLLAHFQYPILHYFRPAQRQRALPVQLGQLLRFGRRVDAMASEPALSSLAVHPSYLALRHSVGEYLRQVDELFGPGNDGSHRDDADRQAQTERAHQRLMDYMLYSRSRDTSGRSHS